MSVRDSKFHESWVAALFLFIGRRPPIVPGTHIELSEERLERARPVELLWLLL